MNGTLIGMKSIDEGKHDLISLVCRVRTSYKPPTLQPGNITEKVAWLYLWQIVNEFVIEFIDCGETWTRDFSTTAQCVNHYAMGHSLVSISNPRHRMLRCRTSVYSRITLMILLLRWIRNENRMVVEKGFLPHKFKINCIQNSFSKKINHTFIPTRVAALLNKNQQTSCSDFASRALVASSTEIYISIQFTPTILYRDFKTLQGKTVEELQICMAFYFSQLKQQRLFIILRQ